MTIFTFVDESHRFGHPDDASSDPDIAVCVANEDDITGRSSFSRDVLEHAFGQVQRLFASSIEARIRPYTDNKILRKCTFLDPRWKRGYMPRNVVDDVVDELANEYVQLVAASHPGSRTSVQDKRVTNNDGLGIFDLGPTTSGQHADAKGLFSSFFQHQNAPLSVSLEEAWTNMVYEHAHFRETVGKLAVQYGGVQATSIESERIFSAGGLTISKKRQLLKPATVNNLLLVDRNMEKFLMTEAELQLMSDNDDSLGNVNDEFDPFSGPFDDIFAEMDE